MRSCKKRDQRAFCATPDTYVWTNSTTTSTGNLPYYSVTQSGGDTILSLYNSPLKTPPVLVSGSDYAGLHATARLYGLAKAQEVIRHEPFRLAC